jgi:hypothetical protein
VNIIACIVVGILDGWLAERITGRNRGLLMNLIVGIIGALHRRVPDQQAVGLPLRRGLQPALHPGGHDRRGDPAGNLRRLSEPPRVLSFLQFSSLIPS